MENSLKNKGLMLKWSVVVLIGLAIALIPANGSFTQEIKLFLVLTAIAMTTLCRELLDVFVVGVMLMLSYVVFGVAGWSVAFSGLTNQTSYVLLGILTMVVVLEETGIMKRVSYYIMSKFGNSYLSVLVGMFIGGIVLNIITFGSCAFYRRYCLWYLQGAGFGQEGQRRDIFGDDAQCSGRTWCVLFADVFGAADCAGG